MQVAGVINLGRSFLNSPIIALVTTAGILVTSLMAGYRLCQIPVSRPRALFAVLIATMFLPPIVTLIPLYRIVGSLGLERQPCRRHSSQPRQCFRHLPDAPVHRGRAGRTDRCGPHRWRVGIADPVPDRRAGIAPAIAALALFAFVYHWNSYLWPLTVLQGNSDNYPIVISLSRLLSYNRGAMNTGLVMAGATLAVLPPLLLFVFLQRFFVDSIVGSGRQGLAYAANGL